MLRRPNALQGSVTLNFIQIKTFVMEVVPILRAVASSEFITNSINCQTLVYFPGCFQKCNVSWRHMYLKPRRRRLHWLRRTLSLKLMRWTWTYSKCGPYLVRAQMHVKSTPEKGNKSFTMKRLMPQFLCKASSLKTASQPGGPKHNPRLFFLAELSASLSPLRLVKKGGIGLNYGNHQGALKHDKVSKLFF